MVTRVPDGWPIDTDVLSVDLDVRERSDADARRAIVEAIARLGADTIDAEHRVFVKIDSTLRGPIAGLIDGALSASGRTLAVVAPAFPEQGRHVRDGRLVVNGETGPNLVSLLDRLRVSVIDADNTASLSDVARASDDHPEWLLVGSAAWRGSSRHRMRRAAPLPTAMGSS